MSDFEQDFDLDVALLRAWRDGGPDAWLAENLRLGVKTTADANRRAEWIKSDPIYWRRVVSAVFGADVGQEMK